MFQQDPPVLSLEDFEQSFADRMNRSRKFKSITSLNNLKSN